MYRMTLFRLLDSRVSLQNSSITCVKFRDLLLVNWNLLVNIQEYDCMLFLLQYLQASDTKEKQHHFKSPYTDVVRYWFPRFLLLYRL